MRKFVQIALGTLVVAALSAPAAFANTITVTPTPIVSGVGPYNWTYAVTLEGNAQVSTDDFFTILDFAGFTGLANTSAPAGWTASTSNSGPCPALDPPFDLICTTGDNPAIPNVTFTRSGATIPGGGIGGSINLGNFVAQSLFSTPINGAWASQDDDLQTQTMNEGAAGNTNVPVAPPTTVPEPASMLLLGAGLVGLAVQVRRRVRS